MTPEFGLFLLKIFLVFDALAYSSQPAKSTLIRQGKQESVTEALPPTTSNSPTTTTQSPQLQPAQHPTNIPRPPYIWNNPSIMWNQPLLHPMQSPMWPQSPYPFVPPPIPTPIPDTKPIQVPMLTVSFGNPSTTNKGSTCPPSVIISAGQCPEPTCNCQCDTKSSGGSKSQQTKLNSPTWQDYFFKSQSSMNTKSSGSKAGGDVDQSYVQDGKIKQIPFIPDFKGFPMWY